MPVLLKIGTAIGANTLAKDVTAPGTAVIDPLKAFKAFASDKRRQMIHLLATNGRLKGMTRLELMLKLQANAHVVWEELERLKNAGMVCCEQKGRLSVYRLTDAFDVDKFNGNWKIDFAGYSVSGTPAKSRAPEHEDED